MTDEFSFLGVEFPVRPILQGLGSMGMSHEEVKRAVVQIKVFFIPYLVPHMRSCTLTIKT